VGSFTEAMEQYRAVGRADRRWLFVPYDQLTDGIGPLANEAPETLGIVLVESRWKARRRPYHKQKLALILSNMRHFALEQSARGVRLKYITTDKPYSHALQDCLAETGTLRVMEPAERELRVELAPLVERGALEVAPHAGWLSTRDDFLRSQKSRSSAGSVKWRMERFYRHMRKKTGLLMVEGKPEGGKLSFDAENRQFWPGEPPAPDPPQFVPDRITREVIDLVERDFAHHPGQLEAADLPATLEDAQTLWHWAQQHCLQHFGPFEDAMSTRSAGLFHTRISSLLNLHRLLPADVVRDACAQDIPLACKEGFVRQILGWREFVRHVHRETDGFRHLPAAEPTSLRDTPGDGGYQRWSGRAWCEAEPSLGSDEEGADESSPDGGALPNQMQAHRALPLAFWGERSGLNCLDRVVQEVWASAYSHHITRLMILCNFAALLDVDPREVTDWFWVAYTDAYDWVVEPNVLGMGLFATGELMTTKPYVSGTPYINRMSDYCASCAFDPKKDCPVSALYWAYLARHAERLASLPRMRVPLSSLRRRSTARQTEDAEVFERVSAALEQGKRLRTS
jgi:deoxyribodipyrimidine photolyase-related protein